ncbi:tRNA pseudouridine synthase B [Minicystis rosea]|nr:tRNA pseudouridine synthase B [Minicystis rosea]
MSEKSAIDGVAVVDKPGGMTSHDVVARVRRLLGTRRVGHAGTLDPMATGVLVVLVGEATKLGPYVTAHEKRYEARVAFGMATDTLDREGTPTAHAEVPAWLGEEIAGGGGPRLAAAIADERARREQIPPAFSAIQVDGRRSYDRARAGEVVELPARPVEVIDLQMLGGAVPAAPELPFVDLALVVSKGFYVRSLARDLGDRLGVPAHLTALRRTASGPFTLATARPLDAEALRGGIVPLDEAARAALPIGRLTEDGVLRARRGQRISLDDFTEAPPDHETAAWLDANGRLVAVGGREDGERFILHRGFTA